MDSKTKNKIKIIHAIEQHPMGMSVEEIAKWLGRDVEDVRNSVKKCVKQLMQDPLILKSLEKFRRNDKK